MSSPLLTWFSVETRTAARGGMAWAHTTAMFATLVLLLPFAFGNELAQLREIALRAMWFNAMLVQVLAMNTLFHDDLDDGTLELIPASHLPLWHYSAGKIAIAWMLYGVPLAAITPILAVAFDVHMAQVLALLASLMVGTLAISALCSLGAAVNLALPRGSVLSSLLVLPLCVPVLIFGISAASDPAIFTAAMSGLFGLALLYGLIAIFATPAIVRIVLAR